MRTHRLSEYINPSAINALAFLSLFLFLSGRQISYSRDRGFEGVKGIARTGRKKKKGEKKGKIQLSTCFDSVRYAIDLLLRKHVLERQM